MKVALYYRSLDEESERYVEQLERLLRELEIAVVRVMERKADERVDYLLSIGGDGTLLSAVHFIGFRNRKLGKSNKKILYPMCYKHGSRCTV